MRKPMPVITFDYKDFISLLGYTISKKDLLDRLPLIGADIDRVDGDELSIEFFPNRPDLTSVEGIARAARAFFGFKPGLQPYTIAPSNISIQVDPSVKSVRPYVVTAVIKNITMNDEIIKSLMDLQEKLHFGLGRNRKKVAIGVHNFEPVTPPFTYKAVDPNAVQFIPLGKTEYMTLQEILKYHEKGVDYAHLLDNYDKYPLIVDANNNVLSFPPIINGSLTEVTPYTSEIFLDVTGTDYSAVHTALTIVATALLERGGQLYSTQVIDGTTTTTTPDFIPKERTISTEYINQILGTSFNANSICDSLLKMGYHATMKDQKNISVQIPVWRPDILHDIDLVEDVAVGFGYDKFTEDHSRLFTIGKTLPHHRLYEHLRTTMIGLGFNEVTTFTISNIRDEFTKVGQKKEPLVEMANPISEDYSCLRVHLLSSLLKLLGENTHHPLPQQVFELGIVVDGSGKNHHHLAAVTIDAKANFTQSKSIVEAVLRGLPQEYSLDHGMHPGFVQGRCAQIMNGKQPLGVFGELHPQTITGFGLTHPCIAFELSLDFL